MIHILTNFKRINKIKLFWIFLICFSFWLLFLDYYCNYFEIVDHYFYVNWQEESEWIIKEKIRDASLYGIFHNVGLLGGYVKQIGLHGILYSFFNKLGGYKFNYEIFYSFNCLVFCLLNFIILFWVKKEFGKISAIFGYFALFFSNWLIASARNLYWVTFTFILPMVSFLILFMLEEKRKKEYNIFFFFLLSFITIFIKSACGYECITHVMISMIAPLIYYSLKHRYNFKKFLLRFIASSLGALSGFFMAILINLIQKTIHFNSFLFAINDLKLNISSRIGVGNINVLSSYYFTSLTTPIMQIIKFYFYDGYPLMFNNLKMINIFNIFFILLAVFIIAIKIEKNNREKNIKSIIYFFAMTFVLFFAPISWFILGSGHSFIHRHIIYMIWSLPFLIILFSLSGKILSIIFNNLFNECLISKVINNHKKITYSFIILIFLIFIYCKYSYIHKFEKGLFYKDNLIYSSKNINIYYLKYGNYLYYFRTKDSKINRNNIPPKKVFLHIINDKKGSFTNRDFNLDDKRYLISLPFWKQYSVSRIPLPSDKPIFAIRTGQYDIYDGKRSWETRINYNKFIDTNIKSISPLDYFEKGEKKCEKSIVSEGMAFIAPYNRSYLFLDGKFFKDTNGEVRQIIKVTFENGGTRFKINGSPIDKNNLALPWIIIEDEKKQ